MAVVDDVVLSIACSGPAVGIFTPAKTGVNCTAVDATNIGSTEAKIASYATAVNGLTLGVVNTSSLILGTSVATGGPSGVANRGSKWIVSAQEATGDLNKFTYTIPAADPAQALTGTNVYDPSKAAWGAFKTAFEALAVSPAGNALTFVSAKLGGRRR